MGETRHLEVHVCTRRGDHVVSKPQPKITLLSGSETQMVPVVKMQGIGAGHKDLHFGNNVQMTKGQPYTVRIAEAGDHVVFHSSAG